MCVTSASATLESTIVGAWEIEHPSYGYRHVMAYQNVPTNLADTPNCMLLHLPAAEPLLPEYLLDTSECPLLLVQMANSIVSRSFTPMSAPQKVYVVEMGIYHVVLLNEKTPEALKEALMQVPLEKRPAISTELLQFYATHFPEYPIVLACFNNRDSKQASPIMLHFKPIDPKHLFYNLLEGHDGTAPDLNRLVKRHQTIIAGSNITQPHDLRFSIPFKANGVPAHLLPFLPSLIEIEHLAGVGEAVNEDGWWSLK